MAREYDHGRDPKLELPDDVEPTRSHRASAVPSADVHEMTKAELVALADERGVDSTGTKAEIAERLGAA